MGLRRVFLRVDARAVAQRARGGVGGLGQRFSPNGHAGAASLSAGTCEKMWVSDGVGCIRAAEERCIIVCPWHNFEFDLDTGRSPCESDRLRIATYQVGLEEDEVVVYA